MPLWFGDVFSGSGAAAAAGGGGGAAMQTAVAQVAASTSAGNQAIGGAGFKPKGAIFFVSVATTADGSAANGNVFSFGATDGTNQWVQAHHDRHGGASSNSVRRLTNDEVIQVLTNTGGVDGEASFVSFNGDGLTINWGDPPAAAYLITVIFFGGTDCECACGLNTGLDGGTVTVSGLSFQPDLVIGGLSSDSAFDSTANSIYNSLGWSDGTNIGSYRNFIQDASSVGDPRTELSTADIQETATRGVTIAMNADGFTATVVGTNTFTSANNLQWFAIYCGGRSVWVGTVDIPTTTGDDAQTGPSFTPQLVTLLGSSHDTLNTNETDGTGAGFCLGAFTADAEFCVGWATEDGAGTMNTQCQADDRAMVLTEDDGTALAEADFVSMDANGWTLNYPSVVPGTVRKALAFAIEAVS